MADKKTTNSEFKAADNLTLHSKDGVPCSNLVEGSKEIKIKKGNEIPEIFVKDLALNRPNQIDIKTKDNVLQLTQEQQKKYGINIAEIAAKKKAKEPKTIKEVIDKQLPKWNMENLNVKLGELRSKGFKEWAEKEFGEDNIDKRKSSDSIIVNILKRQDGGKL